jgi:hypothetical protein
MRCPRAIGLAVVIAAALASFSATGPASATILEDSAGNHVEFFRASDEAGIVFHPPIGSVSCAIGGLQARTLNTGGSAKAVRALVRVLSLRWCRDPVNVLRNGELEIHAAGSRSDGNGTVTSSGLRITLGYLSFHCIFETKSTEIGVLTGSDTTGYVATIDLDGAIPRAGGGSGVFCGSTAAWTGSYQVVPELSLNVR